MIGTGISGVLCAHMLGARHQVTVFEADHRPGGHTHTVPVEIGGRNLQVDTGFLVYNERTYPGLVKLFRQLGVRTQLTDMSFSVSDEETGLEYGGTRLRSLFAQRGNMANPGFLRMLADVVRFHRAGRRLLEDPPDIEYTLADLLRDGRWSKGFVNWFLLPLGASLWSADPEDFTRMPAVVVLRFFERHGMLSSGDKPAWRTVTGGAFHYVDAALAPIREAGRLRLSSPVDHLLRHDDGVEVRTHQGSTEQFDHVVVATHSDQAVAMLADASRLEKEVLGAIKYQPNSVVLHTDHHLMPSNRRAWAAWNYHRPAAPADRVTMTYDVSRLQQLDTAIPVLVTLNRDDAIDPSKVLRRFDYAHPMLDTAAVAAQARHHEISGTGSVSYCGAYWGMGFHEDGVQSALTVCRALGVHG